MKVNAMTNRPAAPSKRNVLPGIVSTALVFIVCGFLINYTWGGVLKLSFFLDDWPFMWLISTRQGLIVNYFWLNDYFTGVLSREGNIPVIRSIPQYIITYTLHSLVGNEPFYYQAVSLVTRFIACITVYFTGWKLTKTRFVGIFAAIYASVTFFGSQSTWWYGTSITYLVAIAALLSIYFYAKALENNRPKFLIASFGTIVLGILSFPIRFYTFLASPFLALIWGKISAVKKIALFVLVSLFVALSVKLVFGSALAFSQNRVAYEADAYVLDSLRKAEYYILLYPLNILSFSLLPRGLTASLINFDPVRIFHGFWITNFRFWGIVFSATWIILVSKSASIAKSTNQLLNYLVISIGLVIIYASDYAKDFLTRQNYEGFITTNLILFEGYLSIFLIMFSFCAFFYLKNTARFRRLVKSQLSFLLFIYSAFFVSWLHETKTAPFVPEVSRYSTISGIFGCLFLYTFLYFIIRLVFEFKYLKAITKKYQTIFTLIVFMLVTAAIIPSNIKMSREYVSFLQNTRRHANISRVLDNISYDIEFTDPPPIIIITLDKAWMWGEGFAVFQHGHSLAVWNSITNPGMIPVISYSDILKEDVLNAYCKLFSNHNPTVYRFSVMLDNASLVEKFKADCPRIIL